MDVSNDDGHEVNLETIAAKLREAGLADAYVEQTGGGTATLLVLDGRFGIGPGWFEEPGYREGRAHTSDLAYGPIDEVEGKSLVFKQHLDEEQIVEKFIEYLDSINARPTYAASFALYYTSGIASREEAARRFVRDLTSGTIEEFAVQVESPNGASELIRISRSEVLGQSPKTPD